MDKGERRKPTEADREKAESPVVLFDDRDYSAAWSGTPEDPHRDCYNAGRPETCGGIPSYIGRLSMFALANMAEPGARVQMKAQGSSHQFDHRSLWDTSRLRSGLAFAGTQTNNGSQFTVQVDIKDVNFEAGSCCGFMCVTGISEDIPELKTFFNGQIIGRHHSFHTRQWGSTSQVDRKHWRKFPGFLQYSKSFPDDSIDYNDISYDAFVFMRWKEVFLAENHTKTAVRGASFAGFYYVCYDCENEAINGFYYHKDSDWFQALNLKQVDKETELHGYDFR